jgi:hypothetical protein
MFSVHNNESLEQLSDFKEFAHCDLDNMNGDSKQRQIKASVIIYKPEIYLSHPPS